MLAYGGYDFYKDRNNLKIKPAIIIGTPGRICSHLDKNTFSREYINKIVLDEFDKSL